MIARTFHLVKALICCKSACRLIQSRIAMIDRTMPMWNVVELKDFMESTSTGHYGMVL